MKQNVDLNFTPGIHTTMANVSTNIDSYYPTLAQAYSEGWRLTSFYRVPGAKQQAFMSTAVNIPFQGIFTKYVLQSDSWLAWVACAGCVKGQSRTQSSSAHDGQGGSQKRKHWAQDWVKREK